MNKIFNSRKAGTFDNIFVAITFFAFAISVFLGLFLWNTISDPSLDEDIWDKTSIGADVKQDAQDFYDGLDFWVVAVFVLIHLSILVTAFLLRSHPVVYIAGLFVIIALIYITVPLEAAWLEVVDDAAFTVEKSEMVLTNKIMANFTTFEMVFGFLTLVILAGFARIEGLI